MAIGVAWMGLVLFVNYVYNPAGIAMLMAQQQEEHLGRFDNNIVSIAILVGWLVPSLVVLLVWGLGRLWHQFH